MTTTWITNATIIDGTGKSRFSGTIAIQNGRISALDGEPRDGDCVIDADGLFVTPGLIDGHTHIGLSSPIEASFSHRVSVAEIAARMFHECAKGIDEGFTTFRDCGGVDAGITNLISTGRIPGPRIVPAGPVQCQTGGHGHFANFWEPTAAWADHDIPGLRCFAMVSNSPHEMRTNVREAFRRGAKFIKLCVTGGVLSHTDELTDTQFSTEEVRVAVEEAEARATYVTVHAHNNEGIRMAVEAGARCIEHGSDIDDETAALMAANGVAHVPTLTVLHDFANRGTELGISAETAERAAGVYESQVAGIAASRRAGVRVGLGSDLIGPDQSRRARELVIRSSLETPLAALGSATRENAEIMGMDTSIGTIEVGKLADLTVYRSNPLSDPEVFANAEDVILVLIEGTVMKDPSGLAPEQG